MLELPDVFLVTQQKMSRQRKLTSTTVAGTGII